jgi:hypothetical protein
MTMIIDGSNGLTYPNSSTQASSSVVLQVVSVSNPTLYSTTSTSFIASGMSASITPKFATSKIFVLATITVSQATSSVSAAGAIALYRSTTALQSPQTYQNFSGSNALSTSPRWVVPINYFDSPATTSSTTYNIYFASYQGTQSISLNETQPATITLMEIAG